MTDHLTDDDLRAAREWAEGQLISPGGVMPNIDRQTLANAMARVILAHAPSPGLPEVVE